MRVRIIAKGIVQGVGFRYFTRNIARELGLEGFIRNLPDGTVELEAEGSEEILEFFITKLDKGPPASNVLELDTEPLSSGGNYEGFEIRP